MNFLAHLYLADRSPEAMVGSLMPDLVRGKLPADLPPAVLAAARQHRRIDGFTDTHPLVARSKASLSDAHRRFAGILIDVFYDHLLAGAWGRYSDVPLATFIAEVHRAFATHAHLMPAAMRYPIDALVSQDWLGSYATLAGVELTLTRMSARFSRRLERDIRLQDAVPELVTHRPALAADFDEFFPQLVRFARSVAADQPPATPDTAPATPTVTRAIRS